MGVARDGMQFEWAPRPGSSALAAECALLEHAGGGWEPGYTSEYCPRLGAWTAAVTASHRAGLALWIDYGLPRRHYYFPERSDGTLICHFRQRASTRSLCRARTFGHHRVGGFHAPRASERRLRLHARRLHDAGTFPRRACDRWGDAASRRRRTRPASRGSRTKRGRSYCRARWVSASRPWLGCAAWMHRSLRFECRICGTRFDCAVVSRGRVRTVRAAR